MEHVLTIKPCSISPENDIIFQGTWKQPGPRRSALALFHEKTETLPVNEDMDLDKVNPASSRTGQEKLERRLSLMPVEKQVNYGREHERIKEKIGEGLMLTPTERHEIALSLSFHVLEVLKARGIEPYEEEGCMARTKRVIVLRARE